MGTQENMVDSGRLTHDRVPIYSFASWISLISIQASFWIDPFRDIYEVSLFNLDLGGRCMGVNLGTATALRTDTTALSKSQRKPHAKTTRAVATTSSGLLSHIGLATTYQMADANDQI